MAIVLLVEDNDDVREMMCVALELAGNQVIQATNGREALARLHEGNPPCLILTDLMMPVMNGWELGAALARDARLSAIPVIVISALAAEMPLKRWARGKLPKPIDVDQLVDVVKAMCG